MPYRPSLVKQRMFRMHCTTQHILTALKRSHSQQPKSVPVSGPSYQPSGMADPVAADAAITVDIPLTIEELMKQLSNFC